MRSIRIVVWSALVALFVFTCAVAFSQNIAPPPGYKPTKESPKGEADPVDDFWLNMFGDAPPWYGFDQTPQPAPKVPPAPKAKPGLVPPPAPPATLPKPRPSAPAVVPPPPQPQPQVIQPQATPPMAPPPATKPEGSFQSKVRQFEAAQAQIAGVWMKGSGTEPSDNPPAYQSITETDVTSLPGSGTEKDFYVLPGGYTYSPRHGGYVLGFDYSYIDWLKKKGVTFWRLVPNTVCDEFGCHQEGTKWQKYDP